MWFVAIAGVMKSLALLALFASIAHAQPADSGEPAYRMETLLVDAAAIGTIYLGVRTYRPLTGLGVLASLLGAPAVHAAHGHEGRAAASIGLRCSVTLLVIAALLRGSGDEPPPLVLPAQIGLVTAALIDAAWLARGRPPRARVVPVVSGSAGTTTWGLVGRF